MFFKIMFLTEVFRISIVTVVTKLRADWPRFDIRQDKKKN
jgi:hypothetical protein